MRFAGKTVLLACLALLFPLTSAFAQYGTVRVVHTPISFAEEGKPLTVEAFLEGEVSQTDILEAKLWFKTRNQEVYDFEEMYYSAGNFSAEIEAQYIVVEGLDYFIEIILDDGSSYTFPANNPITSPVEVNVRGAASSQPEEPVILISPTPFTEVEGRLLIAVAFNQAAREIDVTKIRMRINGRDRTNQADVSTELLTVVIPRLQNKGRQRLDIDYMGPEGMENLGSWSFTWVPEGEGSFRVSEYVQANFTSELRHQKYNGDAQNIFRESFNIRASAGSFALTGSGRLTSEEQGSLQPQHRYLVTAGWPSFRLRYGDIKPRYNELILWGRRIRGTSLDMNAGAARLQMIYGNLTRPIDADLISITPDTTEDDIPFMDTTFAPGTYRRWLGAARVSFGKPNTFMIGFTTMKAKDDITSIDYGENPKDNLVTGADLEMYLDRRRITLTSQVALSLFNENTSEPALDDVKDYQNIIWINQYFDPLPAEGIDTTGSLDVNKVVGSILGNALSHKTRLRIRYLNNDLQAGYKLINRSFRTMGNPTLLNDKQGYYFKDRLRLFKSRLYIEGGMEHYWDNVTGKGDIRNTQDVVFASINAYTGDVLPDVNLSYRNNLNTNDGTFSTYAPDPSQPTIIDTIDTRKENTTDIITLSLMQNLYYRGTSNQLTFAMTTSDRADSYNTLGEASTNMLAFGVRTRYDMPLMTRANFSNSSQTSIGGLTDLSFNLITLRADYFLFNRTLVPYFGPRITLGSGVNSVIHIDPASAYDPTSPDYDPVEVEELRKRTIRSLHVDFSDIEWLMGARWDIGKNHQILLDISYTMYTENGQFEYWNGERFSVNEDIIVNDGQTVDQPPVLDRDDILAMLTYQVRF
ncbi:hypothetical protein KQI63_13140 [bacterium]|nr:hypothetical protein [bacterium]